MPLVMIDGKKMVRANDPTRYEIVLQKGDDRRLVAYTVKRGPRELRQILFERKVNIFDAMNVASSYWEMAKGKGLAAIQLDNGWILRYSGRTQRDAVNTKTELPFIGCD